MSSTRSKGWLERGRALLTSQQSYRVFGTLVADAVTGVLIIFAYRLTSLQLGQAALGEYQAVRALVTVSVPLLLLGSGVVVPRRIARAVPIDAASNPVASMLDAAWLVGGALGSFAICIAALGPAGWWEGQSDGRTILLSTSVLAVGVALCSASMSSLPGLGRFVEFNLLKITMGGLIPVLAVLSAGGIDEMVRNLAALSALLAVVSIWWIRRSIHLRFAWRHVRVGVREIVKFGSPRVVGDFAFYSFLTFPTLAAGAQSGTVAAVLGVGASLIMIGIGMISPISTVVLPWASKRLGDGNSDTVRTHARVIVGASGGCAVVVCLGLVLLAPTVVSIVELERNPAVGMFRVLALAIPQLAVFITLRSFIDAASLRALNTYNSVAGGSILVATLTLLELGGIGVFRFPIAIVVGTCVLAVLSIRTARRFGVL